MAVLTVPAVSSVHLCRRPRTRLVHSAAFVDSSATEVNDACELHEMSHTDMSVPRGTRWTTDTAHVASTPLNVWEQRIDAILEDSARAEESRESPKPPVNGAFSSFDGVRGNIPLQDKFGLLLSICSLLVSVQVFLPRL